MTGILYLVSTPIGEPQDITLRALRVLSEADAVICEERRIGSTLLSYFKISKPLVELNEHTEEELVAGLVERLAAGGKLALISDHGTPLVADPGGALVSRALEKGVRVVPVPGASSLISALVASGLPAHRFRFLGRLPPKTEMRRRALRNSLRMAETLIMIDAPYRLTPILKAAQEELGSKRQMVVACNLTMPDERFVRGTIEQVTEAFERQPFTGEFVCIVEGTKRKGPTKKRAGQIP
jgi:16S rRNA (cytidine1402-2'-O)-methyltransferase